MYGVKFCFTNTHGWAFVGEWDLADLNTLHNVCAVHRGVCSTTGDVEYTGGYHEYSGGYHEYTGGMSWVHQRNIMINVGEGHWENSWTCMETQCTEHLPVYSWYLPVYWTPPVYSMLSPVYWTSPDVLHRPYARCWRDLARERTLIGDDYFSERIRYLNCQIYTS